MPKEVSKRSSTAINTLLPTPQSSVMGQKPNKSRTLIIIIAIFGLIFFFVLTAGPWSPIYLLIQKGEYTATNVTDLKKSIPFYLSPNTEGWEYLSVANKFDGANKIVYYFKTANGDLSSSFGVKLTFPSPVTKTQIVKKFDEALIKANFEPQGTGLGRYCTKENYVIGINAIDKNGNTIFYGFQNELGEVSKTSEMFQLGIDTRYVGSDAKYAPSFCKQSN